MRLLIALALASVLTIPSISHANPPPVEDYGKLPALDMVHLSPLGDRYAYVFDDGKGRQLYVATTQNEVLETFDVGKVKIVSIDWAGEDFVLVRTSSTVGMGASFVLDKQELIGVIALNLRTHKTLQVFNRNQMVDNVIFGSYGSAEIDGRWYGYFGGLSLTQDKGESVRHANTEEDGDVIWVVPDLYRVDLETGGLRRVATGHGRDESWLVGPHGEVVARIQYDGRSGNWRAMSGGSDGRVLDQGKDKTDEPQLLGLSRTADAVLISRASSDGTIIEEAPLAGGAPKTVVDAKSPDYPILDDQSRLWIGLHSDADEPEQSFFSPLTQARARGTRKAFPGYRVKLTSWSDDFSRMIVFTDGGDDSGTYWFVDVAKGSALPLGQVYPTVTAKDVGPVRMIDYKAADGLALRGVLTLPPGRDPKNLPLVVMPHGGPWARDYPEFDYWAQAFASRGYAVFQPNFRSSTGYGQALYEAGYGQWGRKMQTDISDGAAELARQGIVDPKRACIVGWSYGGYAAQAGVTVQQGLYRCAVSMAGVSDLEKQLNYTRDESGAESPDVRVWQTFLGVKPGEGVARDISPAMLAGRADAPILLIHGNDDTVVPIAQSDEMEKALRAAGKPVERVTLKGADHWLLEEDTRVAMLKASVAFVQKYNPADPAPQVATSQGGR